MLLTRCHWPLRKDPNKFALSDLAAIRRDREGIVVLTHGLEPIHLNRTVSFLRTRHHEQQQVGDALRCLLPVANRHPRSRQHVSHGRVQED